MLLTVDGTNMVDNKTFRTLTIDIAIIVETFRMNLMQILLSFTFNVMICHQVSSFKFYMTKLTLRCKNVVNMTKDYRKTLRLDLPFSSCDRKSTKIGCNLLSFCLDVAQGRMDGAQCETRTHL